MVTNETLITRGMFYDGTVKEGDRIKSVVFDASKDGGRYIEAEGTIADIDRTHHYVRMVYDSGTEYTVCITGFEYDESEELKAMMRIFLIEPVENPEQVPGVVPLYMLLDIKENRILQYQATEEAIISAAIDELTDKGTIDHLATASTAGIKPLKLSITL